MNWKAVSSAAMRFACETLVAALFYALLRRTGFPEAMAAERDGLDTVILLIGGVYSVMYAFVIFVIWGQFTDVQTCIMRECNALDDILRFSSLLHPDSGHAIRRAVSDYARRVVKSEWSALSQGRRDQQAEKAFEEVMSEVIGTKPAGSQEEAVYHRLVDIVRLAGEHRDERVTRSLTRIPGTLLRLVATIAAALLLLVFVYPFQHMAAGMACWVLVNLVLSLARLVMLDTDNPFDGICNVSAQPFAEVAAG